MKSIISTKNAPEALGAYSQAILCNGVLYTSGQLGLEPSGNFASEDIKGQTIQAFKNIEAILKEANTDLSNIIKTTCFIKNMEDFSIVNSVYEQFLDKNNLPARSVVEVSRLPKDALIEIEVIATVK